MGANYGWTRDVSDARDYSFAAPRQRMPKLVNLQAAMKAVKNQLTLGSCTGHAVGSIVEHLYPSRPNCSRLFLYYNGRVIDGTVQEDAGAQIRSVIKAAAKIGACRETLMPYDITRFAKRPTPAALKDAQRTRVGSYSRLTSLNAMRGALADGKPVVFGMFVYEAFESERVAKTGVLPLPKDDEVCYGGHAVVAVGYDDKKKRILVRNSWGRHWGQGGYFTMPYDYVANSELCDDFWTMSK